MPLFTRMAGWMTLASAAVSAVAILFLLAMFASFASGAMEQGQAFGHTNDVLTLAWFVLLVPAIVAVHVALRSPVGMAMSAVTAIGLITAGAIIVLQLALVTGRLTFEQQIGPVSVAFLAMGVWYVAVGLLGRRRGLDPAGVPLGVLAALYIGYPVWAVRMARALLRRDGQPA